MTNYTTCPSCGARRLLCYVMDGERVRICFRWFKVQKRAVVALALICSLVAEPVGAEGLSALVKQHELVGEDARAIVTCNDALTTCWTPCEQRMKEAMRAVAPYVTQSVELREVEAVYTPPSARLRQQAEAIERQDVAVQQFRNILKECAQ